MNFSEWVRMLYGLSMGTSVQFIKPKQRYLWPTHWHKVDDKLSLFLGGSGNCGVLRSQDKVLLIDVNSDKPSLELKSKLENSPVEKIIITSLQGDCYGGLEHIKSSEVVLPGSHRNIMDSLTETKFQILTEDQEFTFGEEKINVHGFKSTYSKNELVVYLKSHNVVFMGPLFYNRIHPLLQMKVGVNVENWMDAIEKVIQLYPTASFVPKEGDVGDINDIKHFLSYLKDLNNPEVEFSYCRQNYDWAEIPRITSLEENFDLIRSKVKNYVSI